MKFLDIAINQEVTVQIIWGDLEQTTKTKVAGKQDGRIILQTLTYKGLEIDLSSGSSPDMTFNLYCTDPETEQRVGWTDVTIILATGSDGKRYYAVEPKAANKQSVASERRSEIRMTLDIPGIIPAEDPSGSVPITIHDISKSGVSILIPSSYQLEGDSISVAFSDIVKNDAFVVPMECKIIRRVPQPNDILKAGGTTLLGCTIKQCTESLVTYILAKRTLSRG